MPPKTAKRKKELSSASESGSSLSDEEVKPPAPKKLKKAPVKKATSPLVPSLTQIRKGAKDKFGFAKGVRLNSCLFSNVPGDLFQRW